MPESFHIFGFMFGSIFGFEDVIPALWLRPMDAYDDASVYRKTEYRIYCCHRLRYVPDPDNDGFHIINSARCKDAENIWFDTNGVAGLVFLWFRSSCIVFLFMTGHAVPGGTVFLWLCSVSAASDLLQRAAR